MEHASNPQDALRLIACPHLLSIEKDRIDRLVPVGATVTEHLRAIGWIRDSLSARVFLDGQLVNDAAWEYTVPQAGQALVVRAVPMGGGGGGGTRLQGGAQSPGGRRMLRLRLLVCVVMTGFWLAPAHAVTIFSEDFEVTAGNVRVGTQTGTDLTAKGWTITCENPNPCTGDIVTSPVHGGSKSLRYTYGLTGDNDFLAMTISKTFTGVEEIWERFWIRIDKFDAGQPQTLAGGTVPTMKLHYFNAAGADPISSYLAFINTDGGRSPGFVVQRNFNVLCPSGTTQTTCNYLANMSPPTSFPRGQFVCLETRQKMNTVGQANGILEIWTNGVQTLGYTNITFRDAATASSTFKKIHDYRQSAINVLRYEDDYVVATTRIGGCGTAPPADTTPPRVPAGFAVN